MLGIDNLLVFDELALYFKISLIAFNSVNENNILVVESNNPPLLSPNIFKLSILEDKSPPWSALALTWQLLNACNFDISLVVPSVESGANIVDNCVSLVVDKLLKSVIVEITEGDGVLVV